MRSAEIRDIGLFLRGSVHIFIFLASCDRSVVSFVPCPNLFSPFYWTAVNHVIDIISPCFLCALLLLVRRHCAMPPPPFALAGLMDLGDVVKDLGCEDQR